MEPVRAEVDAFLLDLLEDREFTARDFGELPNGVCRIAAPLTHELALTLLATPRKASQPRPYATRAWRTPTVEARPANPIACALCGEPVLKRRRRHCEACMPKARRQHGLREIEAARKVLAAQTAAGNDPRRSVSVKGARGEAISEGHRRNRSWAREHPEQRDEAWFKREIAPKLDAFTLRQIGKTTGLSPAACSRSRSGARVPHARHWDALLALVQVWSPRKAAQRRGAAYPRRGLGDVDRGRLVDGDLGVTPD
jgi:hypothetical protein